MVEIRTLRPMVHIRMPARPQTTRRAFKTVLRYNRDYPPPTPQPTPCRLWQGAEGTDGYGRRKAMRADGTIRSTSMHRWVFEQLLGRELKPSEVVLHACDNRLCYRIEHLSLGTVQDNNADMYAKKRNSPPPVNVFHGESHPMAKLNGQQVAAIRRRHQQGLKATTIAEEYGVSASTIRRIVSGVRWGRGSTRDLIAEATARAAAKEAAELTASAESGRLPPKRIRPVKKMNIRSMERTEE